MGPKVQARKPTLAKACQASLFLASAKNSLSRPYEASLGLTEGPNPCHSINNKLLGGLVFSGHIGLLGLLILLVLLGLLGPHKLPPRVLASMAPPWAHFFTPVYGKVPWVLLKALTKLKGFLNAFQRIFQVLLKVF